MSGATKALRVAATMLLLRDSDDAMEIFMVVRHHQIEFASGALVFPGGSVDPGDHDIAANPALHRAAGDLDQASLSIRIAAIRETYEESGILLARNRGSDTLLTAAELSALSPQRAGVEDDDAAFATFLNRNELEAATDLLAPFAHWITPLAMPKRFDTHFLLAMAPPGQIGKHDGHESVDSIWISPRQALDGGASGRFTLLFPTIRNLIRLAKYTSAQAALDETRRTPVFTVLPELTKREDGGNRLRIPLEAGYDGDVFDI